MSNFWDTLYQNYKLKLDNVFFHALEAAAGRLLRLLKVPEHLHPDHEHIGIWLTVIVLTLFNYWFWLGDAHRRRRKSLERDLAAARKNVQELEERLEAIVEAEVHETAAGKQKEIRIFMDGAFDMMHYGHMNAFRQGAALGTYLVVGVNSDASITQCKGKPVNSDEERMAMVKGCRWVNEVVEDVPYVMTDEYLKYVIEKYKIDYVVHGDDPCIVDGKDVYETAQKLGKYKTIPRTEGISTTDIVGRMLLMSKSHHHRDREMDDGSSDSEGPSGLTSNLLSKRRQNKVLLSHKSNFLTTSRIIRSFSANFKPPKPEDVVVYLAGSWDMFHCGHVALLEEARKFGTYVIVGVHNDGVVNAQRGHNLPILNLNERVLSVLGCKFVDDVLFDAPFVITNELLSSLNVKFVVKGQVEPTSDEAAVDPYKVPKELNILKTVNSKNDITVFEIVDRIAAQRERYEAKYRKKKVQEDEYYGNKYANAYGTSEAAP